MTAAAPRFRLTPPAPSERDVHEHCAKVLDALLLRPAEWTPYPAGVTQLSPQQMARYSRFGLKRGYPDILIFYQGVYGIELKRHGAYLSETRIGRTASGARRILVGQDEMFPRLLATGAFRAISICHTVDDVLDRLDRWNIPHRRTQGG
jgi:hypothetical protein